VQNPNILLMMLNRMAQKPENKFDTLYPKLYNKKLWVMAYESIATKPGNMTPGTDGKTIDGMNLQLIDKMIADLKASRYRPTPVRREYIPKSNGGMRPLGIPSFEDKLLQTIVKLILEAIYEPTFSNHSHGFRTNRSCHTALSEIKTWNGIRWWVEGDIKGFFDNLNHDTLLRILGKRITDKRFLHLIKQLLGAGYIDHWEYHKTYSGTPQGGNLSPVLSNIYLHELDKAMEAKVAKFNRGKRRKVHPEYNRVHCKARYHKKRARITGDWKKYKRLKKQQLSLPATDPLDPDFRRMYYIRYADDFLIGIIGSKTNATETKAWLSTLLENELQLELSANKTLITNAKQRVRFLGYDIKRWKGERKKRKRNQYGTAVSRDTNYKLALLMPKDKVEAFCKEYGTTQDWSGKRRPHLLYLSELEILMTYNAEIRGFLGYYSLADNLKSVAANLLWLTTTSFFKTLAGKGKTSVRKVSRRLKRGPGSYAITVPVSNDREKTYELISSPKQLKQTIVSYRDPDVIPHTWRFRNHTELGQRLLAQECEWCGTREGNMEVHHVRKLKDLKGKSFWEQRMIARRRKTMVLCRQCHVDLHAGRLRPKGKKYG